MNLKKLKDQVIVITGASSGGGLVTVRMAAARGAKVVAAARNEEALKELVQELKGKGQSAVYVKADVGRKEEVNRIAETAIQTFGRLDTWVNNAGSFIFGQAMEVGSEDAHLLFTTNFWGVVHGTKAAVQHFKERGMPGAVINVVSILGDKGTILQSAYATAKFAVHGWTESIRMELEKEKAPVSITLIRPSRVDTPWNEHGRSYLKKQPAHRGRVYPPEAVAEAILYSAEHPKRDIFVGSQSRAVQLIGSLFPRLMDKCMELTMYVTQQDERPSKPKEESVLYSAGYGLHERGTNKGWIRSGSMYVKASKHPVLTAMAATGAGAAAYWAAMNRKK